MRPILRRDFLSAGAVAAAVATLPQAAASEPDAPVTPAAGQPPPLLDRICLFTDHLDDYGYSYAEVAKLLSQLKVAGADLTVRPGGLVAPERVADELPKAAAAFQQQDLSIPMISTNLTSAADPAAGPTFATMKQLGIGYYKLGYLPYGELSQWRAQLEAARKQLAGLLRLSRTAGVQAGFHNHAGPTIGGAVWDSWDLLAPLDEDAVGFYFDAAQATIEGGKHAWRLNFQRISPRLKMVAIKDFVWEKVKGRWQTRWVPLGQGMVDWPEFFRLLAATPFPGPISLHIEYDPGGASKVGRLDNSLAAAQRDLEFLRRKVQEALLQKAISE